MLPIDAFGKLVIPGFQKRKTYVYAEHCYEQTSHFYNQGLKSTIRVETRNGFAIEGTPNHRIRVITREGNYIFRRLDELQQDDYIAIQRGQNYFGSGVDLSGFSYTVHPLNRSGKKFTPPSIVTTDLAMLMGYLVGDGTTTATGLNKNNIQLTVADAETRRDFEKLCIRLFNEKPKITRDRRTRGVSRFVIHNAKARAFLAYAGLGWHDAGTKEIPWSVLCAPKDIVGVFLSSLFECDGCFSGSTIEYCTKSPRLAEQILVTLLNYGIVAKKKRRAVDGMTYFYLYIEGRNDKRQFLEHIGFRSGRKNKLLRGDVFKKRVYASKTTVDTIPYLNVQLNQFLNSFSKTVHGTNRADWDVVYDYLPAPRGRNCTISYDRLRKILKHFAEGRNLPEYQYFEQLETLHFFFDKITRIEKSKSHVVDFTVPKGSTFFANGFVNHNTTLSLHVIAEAQKKSGICAFIDAEHAMDPEYAKRLGVKIDELLISQPDTGEQALEIVESLVRSGKLDVIVIDSVAALTPKDEIEGDMGQSHVGKQARLMSQALRKLTAIVARSKTIVIFINQIRMQIGVMFGNPETTPGGKALKFYTSVRLDIRRIAQIKKGEEIMGGRVRVKVVKNKVAAPFKQTEFDLMYNEGISREGELIALGEKLGLMKKSGSSYEYDGVKLGRGYDATRQFLRENKKVSGEILRAIVKQLKDGGALEATPNVGEGEASE
ncbi:MAG: recombinase RecA [Candidatus Taylorbacteria bacterium CG11_big_fil_rev_8_21_14_0_20_46_11]|uniref:Protein RecA n=1 Tax=Candidatus Taylorbacteria bacterium CG11_big_fil_rev_8_21_14_0_20_46_11 TaxID=1975025 RepID=A0A2H0KAP0_9BACT|nr:MAG: recombinase RecA [Candidatus Taylorbacteria bacterium CG11_big_fil_rev_8_21_14_0_20_46_11]